MLEEGFSSENHLINYVGGSPSPTTQAWNSSLASVEQRSHNSSHGISLRDFTVQCTMGKLQWGDGNRNFSLLREIMTISRGNVTFTV